MLAAPRAGGGRAAAASGPRSPGRCATSAPAASSGVTAEASTTTARGETTYRAPLVVAADGNSQPPRARRSGASGATTARWAWPSAPTTTSPPARRRVARESWLELWDDRRDTAAPRLRLGLRRSATAPSTSGSASSTPARRSARSTTRRCCTRWLERARPQEWGFRDGELTQPVRGAALPMGFNRKPHYADGLLLVGDSGGMVNPFNGEGIAYAMESGELAAEVDRAGAAPTRRAAAASRRWRTTRGRCRDLRRLLHARAAVREAHRPPRGHAAAPPSAACRTRC